MRDPSIYYVGSVDTSQYRIKTAFDLRNHAAFDNALLNEIFDITKQQFELLEESISLLFSKLNVLTNDPAILDRIRALESMVDAIEDALNDEIYESDMALAEKMQFSGVVDQLCDISDIIEDIADKIQIMLIARKA